MASKEPPKTQFYDLSDLIDELAKKPELSLKIKALIEKYKTEPLAFIKALRDAVINSQTLHEKAKPRLLGRIQLAKEEFQKSVIHRRALGQPTSYTIVRPESLIPKKSQPPEKKQPQHRAKRSRRKNPQKPLKRRRF